MRGIEFDLPALMATIRTAVEATEARDAALAREGVQKALELGFPSVEAMREAKRQEEAFSRQETAIREIREEIVNRLGGRLSDAAAAALLSGAIEATDAVQAVRAWADSLSGQDARPVLVLSGPPGTGKTIAALSFLSSLSDRRRWQFARAVRLGSMFERWSNDAPGEALDIDVPVLIVDDLGQEPLSDRRVIPAIHEILDARKSARRMATIITTNLTIAEAKSRYPDPDISRLAESADWISLSGPDMRRK